MTIAKYPIDDILSKFSSNPETWIVDIKAQGDPKKYRDGFYKAMRRRGYYWKLVREKDSDILHVVKRT